MHKIFIIILLQISYHYSQDVLICLKYSLNFSSVKIAHIHYYLVRIAVLVVKMLMVTPLIECSIKVNNCFVRVSVSQMHF